MLDTFCMWLQDQITVLTQTLSALTQFVTGFVTNTTACILQDPLCSTCLDATTCKTCREVRHLRPHLCCLQFRREQCLQVKTNTHGTAVP